MNESAVAAISAPAPRVLPRPRRIMWPAVGLLVLGLLGWLFYYCFVADRGVAAAMSEADRLDPGWRIEELQAARPAVSDEENSAPVVLAAEALLPKSWPAWPARPLDHASFKEELYDLSPCVQLDDEQKKEVRAALTQAGPALTRAQKLRDLLRGRYNINCGPGYIYTTLPHLQAPSGIAELFSLECTLRAQENDVDGALASALAILHTGRS